MSCEQAFCEGRRWLKHGYRRPGRILQCIGKVCESQWRFAPDVEFTFLCVVGSRWERYQYITNEDRGGAQGGLAPRERQATRLLSFLFQLPYPSIFPFIVCKVCLTFARLLLLLYVRQHPPCLVISRSCRVPSCSEIWTAQTVLLPAGRLTLTPGYNLRSSKSQIFCSWAVQSPNPPIIYLFHFWILWFVDLQKRLCVSLHC